MPVDDRTLVAGELRGYRQFHLRDDGLYPLVHQASGPWDAQLERAQCAAGEQHPAPAADCRCGLYAWYLPGVAAVCLGAWNAVIAARGRTILGDRGFRAATARVEAVALPASVRCWPWAAARARRLLAERYPSARVYGSTRRMLKAHPPQELTALGITPPRDASRAYRRALVSLFTCFVLAAYSLVLLPREAVAEAAATWWPVVVAVIVGYQGLLVWLISRLMSAQGPLADRPR